MITAVDTSVLLDVFVGDESFGPRSRRALTRCLTEGAVIVSDIAWAETTAAFPTPQEALRALDTLGVAFSAATAQSALRAGAAWREYRAARGPRTRMMADFLVGAHAIEQADRLLSRDRGFQRRYFPDLTVIDPTA